MAEPISRRELPYDADRERVRRGGLRGEELLAWLAAFSPGQRERAIEQLLGVDSYPPAPAPLEADLVGYIPSGVAAIVRAVFEVPVTPDDVFVDIGSGLGKAAMIVHLLSGARVRGIELQHGLVAQASARADQLGLTDVSFVAADARDAELDDGSVFFLYLPFTGAVLRTVLQRLHVASTKRDVVVCTLGLDLPTSDWLKPRETDSFWLSIYDSQCRGREAHAVRAPVLLSPLGETIAFERGPCGLG
jgi:hypothetical protein